MKLVLTVLCMLFSFLNASENYCDVVSEANPPVNPNYSEATLSYIDIYKDIAVAEMYRSGIPASIILAQGILESSSGNSNLAENSNNHFGIKCKSYWTGLTYYHKDDDLDDKGKLMDSCFRAYGSVIDSYVDHSNFLMYTAHYSVLFQYDRTDYVSWAHGLKSCGYATDKRYSQKLIDKINDYDLHSFDLWQNPFELVMNASK
ncbi:glucosaminidase domain-containing protein [Saprospiraceae bacterium]|nr:glucosaminidase domain-containing protein [Saprospiraceae bacterium]